MVRVFDGGISEKTIVREVVIEECPFIIIPVTGSFLVGLQTVSL